MNKVVEDKVIKGKTYRLVQDGLCNDCAGGDNLCPTDEKALCGLLGTTCIPYQGNWQEVEDE